MEITLFDKLFEPLGGLVSHTLVLYMRSPAPCHAVFTPLLGLGATMEDAARAIVAELTQEGNVVVAAFELLDGMTYEEYERADRDTQLEHIRVWYVGSSLASCPDNPQH